MAILACLAGVLVGDCAGLKVFLLVRFLLGMRTPLYLAIGALRMDFRRFLVCDVVCATLAVGIFFLLSYLGAGWISGLIHRSEWAGTVILLVAAAGAGLYYRIWKRWRLQSSPHRPGLQGKAQ
ncbi:hypothetical protein A4G26_01820 [Mycobacterium kansasii]|uniref:Uncharacterized protein n=1 Tax=Mycobacterium innocens TaxID=2341083 RepID=A0A498PWJ3_9MYCO|nr:MULTISPECIES: hypothetical protein [Mycobacterium]KZS58861.1 hypothetical protein A4G26_01820 [Mycobacterium kansasii]VBA36643.1 hypothetical protein LAUMK13_01263 [Mycobacterium innocens]